MTVTISTKKTLRSEVIRKVFHVSLTTLFLLPLTQYYNILIYKQFKISELEYYALLTIIAAFINAIQVKRPLIREEILNKMQTTRKRIMDEIRNLVMKYRKGDKTSHQRVLTFIEKIDYNLAKLERNFSEQIDLMERSHEKVTGYIGLTFGALGIFCSYILFGTTTIYGVLALMIVDPVTAIITCCSSRRLPYSKTSPYASLAAFFTYFAILYTFLHLEIPKILILSLVAVLAEAYGIEDNMVIPLAVSFVAKIMGL